jgi:hypothetical protein
MCNCLGEFHNESCKCSCTDFRKDPLCIVHGKQFNAKQCFDDKTKSLIIKESHRNGPATEEEVFILTNVP